MKLFSPSETKQANEQELFKIIIRTKATKDAFEKVTLELGSAEARFELALANQRVRWQQEEDEARAHLSIIQKMIAEQEKRLVPIEPTSEEVHTLYEQAVKLMAEAESKEKDSEQLAEALEERLDEVSDREESIRIKEQKIEIKEKAIAGQENMIKNLSKELDLKWKEYFKTINKN